MNISVALIGKVGKKGHESLGFSNDSGLSLRLYTHAQFEIQKARRLEISIRNIEGVLYAYYTYLISENVAEVKTEEDERKGEKHGRTGSFFGITIRIAGEYSQNILQMYHLLEEMYNKYVYNAIITDTNTDGYLTYLIKSLNEANTQLEIIIKEARERLSQQPFGFYNIPIGTVSTITGKTCRFNINDTESASLYDALFGGSDIYISHAYPSYAEIEEKKNREIEELKKKETEAPKDKKGKEESSLVNSHNRESNTQIRKELAAVEIGGLHQQNKEKQITTTDKIIRIIAIVEFLIICCLVWPEHKYEPVNESVGKDTLPNNTNDKSLKVSMKYVNAYILHNYHDFSNTGKKSEIGRTIEILDTIQKDTLSIQTWMKIYDPVYKDTFVITAQGFKKEEN